MEPKINQLITLKFKEYRCGERVPDEFGFNGVGSFPGMTVNSKLRRISARYMDIASQTNASPIHMRFPASNYKRLIKIK